ncbi:MAG: hypothetical protein QM736_03535 [Vicinamibacterales bacterium]
MKLRRAHEPDSSGARTQTTTNASGASRSPAPSRRRRRLSPSHYDRLRAHRHAAGDAVVEKSVNGLFALGQTVSTTDIVISNAGSVAGTLKRGDGTPVAGVAVVDGWSRTTQPTRTDSSSSRVCRRGT